jgi:cytochrome b561
MTRYPRALIVVHWLVALLLIGALAVGKTQLDGADNADPAKIASLKIHMQVGGVILLLLVLRIVLRLRGPNPPTAGVLSGVAHGLLYIGIAAMLGSGIAMSLGYGLPGILWGGAGPLPAAFEGPARAVHGYVAGGLIALIALHVLAALYHALIRKDGIMARMSLRR